MLDKASDGITSFLSYSATDALQLIWLLLRTTWALRPLLYTLSLVGLLAAYMTCYRPQSRFETHIKSKRFYFEVARQILRQNWEMSDEFKDQCDAIINRCQVKIAFIDEEVSIRMPFFTGNFRPKYIEMTYRADRTLERILSAMQEDPKTFQHHIFALSQMVESLQLDQRDWYYTERVHAWMSKVWYAVFGLTRRPRRA